MERSPFWEATSYSSSLETRRFITVFTRTHHWYLSWARCILSTPSHATFLRAFRPTPGPTQLNIQLVPGALSPVVKRPRLEVPSLRKLRRYTSLPQYVCIAWCLVKQRDNFVLHYYSNIIFPSTPTSSKWCFLSRFSNQNPQLEKLML